VYTISTQLGKSEKEREMGFDMFIWNLILDIEYPVRDRAGYDGTPTSCGLSQHFFPLPSPFPRVSFSTLKG
jgi:hypothetical protein